jgi:hypothetical protein
LTPELPDVVGRKFPGGSYTIDPEQNATVCRLLGTTPAPDGTAHPMYAYVATRVGCGFGVDEICAAADFKTEDGPMVGSLDLAYHEPLRVGETYAVGGEFTSIERKQGRRAGVFDLLEFELRLTAPDGTVTVTATQSWVLPRREADHA